MFLISVAFFLKGCDLVDEKEDTSSHVIQGTILSTVTVGSTSRAKSVFQVSPTSLSIYAKLENGDVIAQATSERDGSNLCK